jgi:hypothetical protein
MCEYALEFRNSQPTGERPMELRINGKSTGSLALVLIEGIEVDMVAGKNSITVKAIENATWLDHLTVLYLGHSALESKQVQGMLAFLIVMGRLHLVLSSNAHVTIELLEYYGRGVVRIMHESKLSGNHDIALGLEALSWGFYFLRGQADEFRFRSIVPVL